MKKTISGFSLIEMLIVIAIFSIVAVIITQSLTNSLRSSEKSENIGNVKKSLEYSLSTMERLIRDAQDDIACNPSPMGNEITYTDRNGTTAFFRCIAPGGVGQIASGSANLRLTSDRVNINDGCAGAAFNCIPGDPVNHIPPSVEISLSGSDITTAGAGSARAEASTRIQLRTY